MGPSAVDSVKCKSNNSITTSVAHANNPTICETSRRATTASLTNHNHNKNHSTSSSNNEKSYCGRNNVMMNLVDKQPPTSVLTSHWALRRLSISISHFRKETEEGACCMRKNNHCRARCSDWFFFWEHSEQARPNKVSLVTGKKRNYSFVIERRN
mmetsp:Transcript_23522/g.39904  ORF Transcript_23522/g.39904 Transcript_23522/m.39904 type:complete len:155 (+) Transcript_23522:414-878(+)